MTSTGLIASCNPAAERTFGYAGDAIVGQPMTMLMPESWRAGHAAGLRRYHETGETSIIGHTLEVAGLRNDGVEFPAELTVAHVDDGHVGHTPLFIGIVRDITDRKHAEETANRRATLLRQQAQFFDLAFAAILFRDLDDGTIQFWNCAAEELYGWSKTDAIGHVAHDLLQTHFPQPLDEIESDVTTSGHWAGDLQVYDRDGQHHVIRSRWAVQRNTAGRPTGVLEIHTDVTEQRRIASERTALLAAAEEYSRQLEELATLRADFSAMVAHELSAPLAAIRGFIDLLGRKDLESDARERVIEIMRGEADLLRTLVTDVLTAARAERADFAVQLRPVHLDTLVADALSFAQSFGDEHPVTASVVAQGMVLADPERIGQVLRNLLGNAAKYTPPGTPVELQVMPRGTRVRIEVIDRGPGIHPEDLTRIFEKFGRGRDTQGQGVHGVGLGLYLSRRIIQAHGFDLLVQSAPSEGSVFAFELEVTP